MTQSLPPRLSRVQLPWLSLGGYGLSLGLVGWSLSLFSVLTYGVAFLVALTAYFLTRRQRWFQGLLGQAPQVLLITLLGSVCVTALFVLPNLTLLIILPALSAFLAWQELLYRGYSKGVILGVLVIIAVLGLGVGEIIDLYWIPFSSLNFHVHRPSLEAGE